MAFLFCNRCSTVVVPIRIVQGGRAFELRTRNKLERLRIRHRVDRRRYGKNESKCVCRSEAASHKPRYTCVHPRGRAYPFEQGSINLCSDAPCTTLANCTSSCIADRGLHLQACNKAASPERSLAGSKADACFHGCIGNAELLFPHMDHSRPCGTGGGRSACRTQASFGMGYRMKALDLCKTVEVPRLLLLAECVHKDSG